MDQIRIAERVVSLEKDKLDVEESLWRTNVEGGLSVEAAL